MASDALYNFSDKADNEDASLKVNMDELFVKKQQLWLLLPWAEIPPKLLAACLQ